ncbi:AAA family ATPase [Pseudoalteromonas denitrificans]|uniref:DNA-directed DNA polymerase n=1 Tax=Pseudoalteromonas denitrificans DSM 6059 TaxID=1123010 RepID=A0A1I1P7I1_9GAMM|nr:AAA family ATPase [Pseudoalteromonas denitrificans]SFD05675.1 DNA polymerase III, delta prime subunit [Pseudoalteromonas denitrificans DSM 6059]
MIYPWLNEFKKPLEIAYSANRLHHGILLSGQEGIGKAEFSEELAKGLLCNSSANQLEACGHCKSCQLQQAGTHPDKLVIGRDKKTIGVDEVRKVAQFVQSSAGQNANKVIILLNVHLMTTSAANALLKTLEEPNAHRYLLLVTHEPMRLSATIRSRCLDHNLAISHYEDASNWLSSFDLINQPWHILFAQQPLLLLNWHQQGDLNQLDKLYFCIENLQTQADLQQINEILKQKPEFISVFSIFLFATIKDYLVQKRLSFSCYQKCIKLLANFDTSIKTILGLNVPLAISQLIFSLQEQFNLNN